DGLPDFLPRNLHPRHRRLPLGDHHLRPLRRGLHGLGLLLRPRRRRHRPNLHRTLRAHGTLRRPLGRARRHPRSRLHPRLPPRPPAALPPGRDPRPPPPPPLRHLPPPPPRRPRQRHHHRAQPQTPQVLHPPGLDPLLRHRPRSRRQRLHLPRGRSGQ